MPGRLGILDPSDSDSLAKVSWMLYEEWGVTESLR